jgi:hypothetical protein
MNATARQKTDLLIVVCLLERKKQESMSAWSAILIVYDFSQDKKNGCCSKIILYSTSNNWSKHVTIG